MKLSLDQVRAELTDIDQKIAVLMTKLDTLRKQRRGLAHVVNLLDPEARKKAKERAYGGGFSRTSQIGRILLAFPQEPIRGSLVAKELGLPQPGGAVALKRLTEQGYIERVEFGIYQRTEKPLPWPASKDST